MKKVVKDGCYYIENAVYGSAEYEGLRRLWAEVFGDPEAYADAIYENFGEEIRGYAVTDEDGRVCSSLSCYLCGSFEGKPVYASYAVCTAEDCRGLGLAGILTEYVRDEVISRGGISVVSPAEASLVSYYEKLGYEPFFFASECSSLSPLFDMDDYDDFDDYDIDFGEEGDFEALMPDLDIEPLTADTYNRYREAYLSGRPHIELSDAMLRLVEAESMDGGGLYSINRGDAVCAVSEVSPAAVTVTELISNPVLLEISEEIEGEIAAMIAKHFGAAETIYRTPGYGRCQSMAAGIDKMDEEDQGYYFREAYFGFPVD